MHCTHTSSIYALFIYLSILENHLDSHIFELWLDLIGPKIEINLRKSIIILLPLPFNGLQHKWLNQIYNACVVMVYLMAFEIEDKSLKPNH